MTTEIGNQVFYKEKRINKGDKDFNSLEQCYPTEI
jgi:hypothetical protein